MEIPPRPVNSTQSAGHRNRCNNLRTLHGSEKHFFKDMKYNQLISAFLSRLLLIIPSTYFKLKDIGNNFLFAKNIYIQKCNDNKLNFKSNFTNSMIGSQYLSTLDTLLNDYVQI